MCKAAEVIAPECAMSLYKPMQITAIILAAGKGTRMKSALPKPLHQVGGRAMLAWSIDAARASGADTIITVLGPDSTDMQNWLDGQPFAIQQEQLGTGSAVAAAKDAAGNKAGVALIMFADTPLVTAETLTALIAKVEEGAAIAISGFVPDNPSGYGRLLVGDTGSIECIVEHREATAEQLKITLCNGGIMAVKLPLLFELLGSVTNDNAKGEYYLTDIVAIASKANHRVEHVVVEETEIMGVNDRHDLAAAEAALQDRLRRTAMELGVTLQAPHTVFLSPDATFERDVIIEPHVIIGDGCHIGEGTIIRAFSHLEGAKLGACCMIGPYARLRPGTAADDGVRIGNFVEVKKSNLGAGAKANHLSYIGDAEIGKRANIGAGTITCNYDGYGKFKTLIGEDAFIGSNSALVAPVSIGARAIIGAGSTITTDVADDSVALTRAPTKERVGAATAFRSRREAEKSKAKGD